MPVLPPKHEITIGFAHVAYQMAQQFALRNTGLHHFEVRTRDELDQRIGEADVLVVSGLWRNELIARTPKLRFIQSISAGTNQYSREALRAAGVRLASAQGANEHAVAEHAIALILAFARQLHTARDNQARRHWRGMISDLGQREDELGGKTLLIVGLGRIGSRLAAHAHAFGMRVIATKRDPDIGASAADLVVPQAKLMDIAPQADFIALTCPLTPETERLVDARLLSIMKPRAVLINVARGRVVDEPALIEALHSGRLAGAALDCTWDEPLAPDSPLWDLVNVIITPHTAGETRRYEDNVLDLMMENLNRLWRGETRLRNEIV